MKRRLISILATLVMVALLAACGGTPSSAPSGGSGTPSGGDTDGGSAVDADGVDRSKLSKELNFFNWTEYMPQEILTMFEQEYGVRINYDMYSSNEELLAKLQAGGANYDLIVPTDYMVKIMADQGMLEVLDHDNIPNMKYLDPQHMNLPFDPGNVFTVPYMWGTTALVYNTKYVQEPVDSWLVLWDPKYKGRVILNDDVRGVVGLGLHALGYSLNDTDPDHLEQAKQKLIELMPNVKAFDSDSPKTKLLAEEVWIGQVWNGEAALLMQESDNFKYVIPKEGASIWMDNMAIPKGAKNKYTAEVFINFLLRPEVSKLLGEEFPYGLPNKAAIELLPEELRNNSAAYPPSEWISRTEWIMDVGEATETFDRIFTEVKGGE